MNIENEILKFIETDVLTGQSLGKEAQEVNLIESGILDSMSITNLVNFIHEKFQVEIEPGDVTPENFKSINSIAALVNKSL